MTLVQLVQEILVLYANHFPWDSSHVPASGFYSQLAESQTCLDLTRMYLPFRVFSQIFIWRSLLISPTRAMRLTHLNVLHLSTRKISGGRYKMTPRYVILMLLLSLDLNIPHSTLFSNIHCVYSSLRVTQF